MKYIFSTFYLIICCLFVYLIKNINRQSEMANLKIAKMDSIITLNSKFCAYTYNKTPVYWFMDSLYPKKSDVKCDSYCQYIDTATYFRICNRYPNITNRSLALISISYTNEINNERQTYFVKIDRSDYIKIFSISTK